METIGIFGALAAILLVIELLVVVVVVGAIVYFLRRGVIVGRQKMTFYLQQATEKVQQVEALTQRYASLVVSSQVEAISTVQGLRRGLHAFLRSRH